jgi:pimeloyl-ACP methyl ester carboxylesterase
MTSHPVAASMWTRRGSLTYVPVTIVEAALSPPFLRRSCARLKRLIPQARIVTLADSGHHVGVDAADELLGILRAAITATAASPK